MSRATPAEWARLPLRCHALLHDVPLHDVWVVELSGGGPGRTMRDVGTIAGTQRPSLPVQALFTLRRALGRLFRLDTPRGAAVDESYVSRLTDDDRARSQVVPGTMLGPFRAMYVFADEALLEARNATVHAFLASALRPCATGYTLYGAVYVKPVGRITGIYMALIDPVRRLVVYPSLIDRIQKAWSRLRSEVPEVP
jgi:uncharacterized protein DUF2867